ncbi:lantibiotic dehydratase [Streptomyces sp. SID5785]|uniref:lantibiotic dehydratase n=1 Tax=Streptomyces sp. SID5785 TaxID=2690309 RepID=UPI0031BB3CB2
MLRATTEPAPAVIPHALNLDDAAVSRAWLTRLFERPEVRNALFAASPVLTRTVESIVGGTSVRPRQVRRAALSVASYLLRWQHRPTPFGLFSGAAALTAGQSPRAQWGIAHHVTLRADGEWISDVIKALESDPEVLDALYVTANDTVHVRGNRLVAPGVPADGHDRLMAPVEMTLRPTRPVVAALETAASPLRYGSLRDELTIAFPAGAGSKLNAVLHSLITHNLLITSLRPPMTVLDPLDHICQELKRIDAHSMRFSGALARELYDLRDDLAAHAAPAAGTDLRELTRRMHQHSQIAPLPVVVDTTLDCDVQVPVDVVTEAETAVSVLHQVSPRPYGHDLWRSYHWRFREQYGPGAQVPVLTLLRDSELGWPAEYVGAERRRAPASITERDRVLLRLLQQTQMAGCGELVLDATAVSELAQAAGEEDRAYSDRSEFAFQIHARSTRALAQGDFLLEAVGVPRPGSSMLGRSAHLLSPDARQQIADSYAARPEIITAQLSFSPRRRRNENITRTGPLMPFVIPIGEHPPAAGEVISLGDLAVTANARHLFLIQISTGRVVDVRVPHALEAGIQTPPLARFLAEIAGARRSAYGEFDFGAAARQPYLPRVRYGRTVLSPARWLLARGDLPGRNASFTHWDAQLAAWQVRLNVPQRVAVEQYDQRLPLHLDHPVHGRLLRAALDGTEELELHELPDADAHGWIGRAHEIVLPFVRQQPASVTDPVPQARTVAPAELYLPGGGDVLRMHLHTHPSRFDEILLTWIPRLLDRLGGEVPWWFARQRDLSRPEDGQHLEVTLHLNGGWGTAAAAMNGWARELHDDNLLARLTLEPYRPQTGRYGTAEALDAAHHVFCAESRLAVEQIRHAEETDVAREALTAWGLLGIVTQVLDCVDAGLHWLIANTPAHGRPDRDLRRQVIHLWDESPPADAAITAAWNTRCEALFAYRLALLNQEHDPCTVVRSLLHQHHVRALGVDPKAEATVLHLARTVALRHAHVQASR